MELLSKNFQRIGAAAAPHGFALALKLKLQPGKSNIRKHNQVHFRHDAPNIITLFNVVKSVTNDAMVYSRKTFFRRAVVKDAFVGLCQAAGYWDKEAVIHH